MDWTDIQLMTKASTVVYGEPYKAVVLFKNLEWPYNVAKYVQNGEFHHEYIDIGLI